VKGRFFPLGSRIMLGSAPCSSLPFTS
jgi:hypothetical protein